MTYEEIKQTIFDSGFTIENLPLTAKNEDGEHVIIEYCGHDEHGEPILSITTLQKNSRFARKNYYWYDGTVEETYFH